MFTFIYCISSYSFRGNYSFLKLEIQRSQYIRPNVTVHKGAETFQGRKLFKGGNYMRKYGICTFGFGLKWKTYFRSFTDLTPWILTLPFPLKSWWHHLWTSRNLKIRITKYGRVNSHYLVFSFPFDQYLKQYDH